MSKDKEISTPKEFAHKYSRQFESLSFIMVENDLQQFNIEYSELTQAQKDGGYDGYYIISPENSSEKFLVLMESKLRSNFKADLRLDEFSKSIIISINKHADKFYIITNLHFSAKTREQLNIYSKRTGLNIQSFDLARIKLWLASHANKIDYEKISAELIQILTNAKLSGDYTSLNTNVDFEHIKKKYILIGSNEEQSRQKISDDLVKLLFSGNRLNLVVEGPYGVGKSYFIRNTLIDISNVIEIDLKVDDNYRSIFLKLLFQIWSVKSISQEMFDSIFSIKNCSELDSSQIASLKQIIFEVKSNNNWYEDVLILEDYLMKILKPILKRVNYVLCIYGLETLRDQSTLNFIKRVINRLNGHLSIFIESDADIPNELKDLFFKEMSSVCKFKYIQLSEWSATDAKKFLISRQLSASFSDTIVNRFGCNAAVLDAAANLQDIDESVNIVSFLNEYKNTIRFKDTIVATIADILKFSLVSQYPVLREVFTVMSFFDGKFYCEPDNDIFKVLIKIFDTYGFLVKDENFFVINKESYLLAIQSINWLEIYERQIILQNALKQINQYSSEKFYIKQKQLEIGLNTINENLILSSYNFVASYLMKQGSHYKVKKQLLMVYNLYLKDRIKLNPCQTFDILNKIVECYLNISDDDYNIDSYVENMHMILRNNCSCWKNEESYNYAQAKLIKKRCGLALKRGHYKSLIDFAGEGIKVLKSFYSERCREMRYEFWNYKALGVKHYFNLRKSIQVYKECLHDLNILNKKLFRWYFAAKSSLVTYRNPFKALNYINRVYKQIEKNKIHQIVHHEVNMSGLSLMTGNLGNATRFCNSALQISKDFYIQTERARCLNIAGCIDWAYGNIQGARKLFKESYDLFNVSPHQTYLWIPLVNKASLEMEIGDKPNAIVSAVKASEILLSSHTEQFNKIDEEDLLFSKSYLAILKILQILKEYNDENTINEILATVNNFSLNNHYNNFINHDHFKNLVKDSHVFLFDHFMLKT